MTVGLRAEDYLYITNDGTITITGYTGTNGSMVIPGIINNLPVAAVGDNAFIWQSGLASATIPDSVTYIGNQAFFSCVSLTNITIGSVASVPTSERTTAHEAPGIRSTHDVATMHNCKASKAKRMKAWPDITHYAGFDWAREHHAVIIVDLQGQMVADFEFEHSLEGWKQFSDKTSA